jgi:uncharacterized protein
VNEPPDEPERLSTFQFMLAAGVFEGGLLVLAFVVGLLIGVRPAAQLTWSWQDLGWGILATLPMLLLFAASWNSSWKTFREIREFLRDVLGPLLDDCGLLDIITLALLAGVCEEVLFRGLIWQYLNVHNAVLALLLTNLLFGLAHSVTPLYAIVAGIVGIYLTLLMSIGDSPNLLIPMTAHSLYDFIAFLVVRYDYRQHRAATQVQDS